jgi:hypothetical protein
MALPAFVRTNLQQSIEIDEMRRTLLAVLHIIDPKSEEQELARNNMSSEALNSSVLNLVTELNRLHKLELENAAL